MKSVSGYIRQINDIDFGVLKIVCIAVVFSIVLAGVWPFNFFPKNKVKWLQNRSGIFFYGQGMIISSCQLPKTNELLFPDRSISLEFRLKPINKPAHIVDLYDDKLSGVISVGQWRSYLIIQRRINDPAQFKRGEPFKEIGLSNALLKNRDVFITISSDNKGSAVYMNGMPARFYPGFQLLSAYKDEPLYIIIGNSPAGQNFWNGEFMGLAIYNRVLTPRQIAENYKSWMKDDYVLIEKNAGLLCFYPFNENEGSIIHNHADPSCPLIIPKIFKPVKRIFLEPLWQENKWNLSYIQDVTINLLGFIPFGFFISAFLSKTRRFESNTTYFLVVIAGFVLSLSIELIQAYLPTRSSQLSDLVFNTFGTVIGVAAHKLVRLRGQGSGFQEGKA